MNKKEKLGEVEKKLDMLQKSIQDDMPMISMPMYSYEAERERNLKEKRLLIRVIAFLIAVILGTVGAFLLYLNQFDYASYEYSQDGQGTNIIGDSNEVTADWGSDL